MKNYDMAVQAAEETLAMYDELIRLRDEVADLRKYRALYAESLNHSISFSKEITASVLTLALTPGVMDARAAANKAKSKEKA
jgi:hypothetical protein